MTEREYLEMMRRNPELRIEGDAVVSVDTRPEANSNAAFPVLGMSEHELQCMVVEECDRRAVLIPEYGLIFAIPNGGARHPAVAAKLKSEGVKAGVPDLFLPVARHGYHGMFIELKIGANKQNEAQVEWFRRLRMEGYRCDLIWDSAAEVIERIEWYLEG